MNDGRYIEDRIQLLEDRVAALEGYKKHPYLLVLSETVCDHCGEKWASYGSGAIVCGAMPTCPHCGKFPHAPWEKCKGGK